MRENKMISEKNRMGKWKKTAGKAVAILAASAVMFTSLPAAQVQAASSPYNSKWTTAYSWADTIGPALKKTTDADELYQELKLGIQYKVMSEGDIKHLYDQNPTLPLEALQRLSQDGYVSGYLYKLLSGEAMTAADMTAVFDADYYYTNNPDIHATIANDPNVLFQHFLANGMAEGRKADADFILADYKTNYPDLVKLYGNSNAMYYQHYLLYGKFEGRVANKLLTAK